MHTRLKWLTIVVVFIVVDIASVILWRHYHRHPAQVQVQVPRFEDYRCMERLTTAPQPPDLTDPHAHAFRTRLTEGAQYPPDFAGFYTVVEWGCGSPCQTHALIDRRTGKVYFLPHSTAMGAEYHLDSCLLVANPAKDVREFYEYGGKKMPPPGGTRWLYSYYYLWNETQKGFHLIYTDDPKRMVQGIVG